MAAAQDEQNKNEKLSPTEQLIEFVQKNRKAFFIGFASIIAVIAVLIVGVSVRDKMQEKALSRVEAYTRRYEELKAFINSDEPEAALKQVDLAVLLVEIDGFSGKSTGFPAARAYSLSAAILSEQKNWDLAEKAYLDAAKAAGKSYLAPVSFYNAAVAAEESGNAENAVAHYKRALDYGNIFPAAARAQFSIGRVEESRGNTPAALEAYNTLIAKWPSDPVWTNLAQSRILALSD